MNTVPNSERLQISFFGKRNVGKSTLFNVLLNQSLSIVSQMAGTTTDPVKKAVELHGIGPCLLTDTAGIDDVGNLGLLRVEKTKKILKETDIAIVVLDANDEDYSCEMELLSSIKDVPRLCILNKGSGIDENRLKNISERLKMELAEDIYVLDGAEESIRERLISLIKEKMPEDFFSRELFEGFDLYGKTVVAVMPQDKQAPKGRLIMPQTASIRELLEKKANVLCCVTENFSMVLNSLREEPFMVLADSTALADIKGQIPKSSILTTFSAVFAAYKGDVTEYRKGAEKIEDLKDGASILIAELCSHDPIEGDIGRVKIPDMLRKKTGKRINTDICSGADFPEDLTKYSLIIQCGACMANRKAVMNRIRQARKAGVPITNYGILIAKLQGIEL